MRRALVTALLCAVTAAPALACPPPLPPEPERPLARTQVGFDFGFGPLYVGDSYLLADGFGVTWGRRINHRLLLQAEGQLWLVLPGGGDGQMSQPRHGSMLPRAGAVARLTLGRPEGKKLRGDFWIDVGAGVSRVVGYGAGDARADLVLGVGTQLEGWFSDADSRSRVWGGYLSLRAIAPVGDPSHAGFFFSVGYLWGS